MFLKLFGIQIFKNTLGQKRTNLNNQPLNITAKWHIFILLEKSMQLFFKTFKKVMTFKSWEINIVRIIMHDFDIFVALGIYANIVFA